MLWLRDKITYHSIFYGIPLYQYYVIGTDDYHNILPSTNTILYLKWSIKTDSFQIYLNIYPPYVTREHHALEVANSLLPVLYEQLDCMK